SSSVLVAHRHMLPTPLGLVTCTWKVNVSPGSTSVWGRSSVMSGALAAAGLADSAGAALGFDGAAAGVGAVVGASAGLAGAAVGLGAGGGVHPRSSTRVVTTAADRARRRPRIRSPAMS